MGEMFKKENCLTVPNLLSLFRIGLIPLILWFFCWKEKPVSAAVVIGLSGLTDVADGYIARRFHQVSDLGKLLDPLADKLTQIAMLLCLVSRYPALWSLISLFAVKELCIWILGALVICKDQEVNSARWFGKMNTVVLYGVLMVLFLFPEVPEEVSVTLIRLSGTVMLLTFFLYARQHIRSLVDPHKKAA